MTTIKYLRNKYNRGANEPIHSALLCRELQCDRSEMLGLVEKRLGNRAKVIPFYDFCQIVDEALI